MSNQRYSPEFRDEAVRQILEGRSNVVHRLFILSLDVADEVEEIRAVSIKSAWTFRHACGRV